MRARVTLRGSETFTGRGGKRWRKNQSRELTSPAEVAYYERQAEFTVTRLGEPASRSAPASEESEGTRPPTFSERELKRIKKEDLVDLAAKGFGLVLDPEASHKDMVAAILEAQSKA